MYAIGFCCCFIQLAVILAVYLFSNNKLGPLRNKTHTKAQRQQKKTQ
jgi:hypothetical protein